MGGPFEGPLIRDHFSELVTFLYTNWQDRDCLWKSSS